MRHLEVFCRRSLAAGVVLGVCSASSAVAIEIRYGDHVPTVHYASTEGAQKWFERVQELTDGEAEFTYYPAEQASKAREMLGAVQSGLLDCAYVGAIYTSEKLPVNTIFGLPGFITDATGGTEVYQQLLEEDTPFRREWLSQGVTPVWGFLQPPNQAFKTGGPIETMADWEGLKVRVSGESVAMAVELLGAVPVRFAAPEMYTGLDRGALDVSLLPFATAKGYRINEVTESASTNLSLGSWNVTIVCQTEKWESWPEDVRQAMIKAGQETSAHLAQLYDSVHDDLVQQWSEEGLETFEVPADVVASMREKFQPVAEEWVERVGGTNPEAAEAMELYRSMTSGD